MNRRNFLLSGILGLVPASSESASTLASEGFQAAFSALVPGNGGQFVIGAANSVFTWIRQTLPYTVPVGYELQITDVGFGSKYVNYTTGYPTNGPAGIRSSYLAIDNVLTLPEHAGPLSLKTPFRIPAGKTLNVSFWNNSPEAQWMNGFILGQLVAVQ